MPEDERRAYDGYLAYFGQELGILDSAKAEGREEGREVGREEGMIAVAKKLIKKGLTVEDIAETTELSIETIEELARELGL